MTLAKRSIRFSALLAVLPLTLAAALPMHLELVDSYPKEEQVLTESPAEIWLRFSVAPDMEQTSFSVRGPDGSVELGTIAVGDASEVIRATVTGELGAGEYTLSWVGAPPDDHAVRGRYTFTVAAAR
jgi:methionine-rich copper-binding protein CopC